MRRLDNPLRRLRAFHAAVGVLAELEATHTLTGYDVGVCAHDDAATIRVWGTPAAMAALFPAKAHKGPWYGGDRPQRNLTRVIRGVEVSTIQNKADFLAAKSAALLATVRRVSAAAGATS